MLPGMLDMGIITNLLQPIHLIDYNLAVDLEKTLFLNFYPLHVDDAENYTPFQY
jgi:ABC-type uncharacterized transport system permease subunit